MVNHILHRFGDRTLCEPDSPDSAAPHISTDPDLASCSYCVRAYEQVEGLRVSLGLTDERRVELRRRAEAALEADAADPLTLAPDEVITLLDAVDTVRGPVLPDGSGVLPVTHRQGVWESSAKPESGAAVPPFTPGLSATLKPDFNYVFHVSDVDVDRRVREQACGHLRPRPDGHKAKCPGPDHCGFCRRERELIKAGQLS